MLNLTDWIINTMEWELCNRERRTAQSAASSVSLPRQESPRQPLELQLRLRDRPSPRAATGLCYI
jgi:hypothetical protein